MQFLSLFFLNKPIEDTWGECVLFLLSARVFWSIFVLSLLSLWFPYLIIFCLCIFHWNQSLFYFYFSLCFSVLLTRRRLIMNKGCFWYDWFGCGMVLQMHMQFLLPFRQVWTWWLQVSSFFILWFCLEPMVDMCG